MIKFTDVIKANGKFWYILVALVVICFCAVFGLTFNKNSYRAGTTLAVEQNKDVEGGDKVSMAEIERQIKELNVVLSDQEFWKNVITEISQVDAELANELSINYLKSNLKVDFKKGENFFSLGIESNDKKDAITIINVISDAIVDKYNEKYPEGVATTKVVTLINTQVEQTVSKSAVYGIIGILIGIVLAEIVITCILAFGTKVKDSDILKRETELDILVKLDRVKGDK